ncbi:BatA domain-containing protein [uncultured Sunxiuqinia sp.]|uniref:BatA domain-containing protein n=1 Tax=uncultured Sunxiuqinia sp. TaxID=1573825 RepID=UPI002629EF78|nr:BatA domain-containing protein [uncultured Sunxiuqinia sp.]
MRFIYPEFLPALLFISIPILIHFLHFKRYKTVYFSQVNFLKTIKEETRKKNNLKQLLILICRVMAVIALVFVFAQPYFPVNQQERHKARQLIAIYVDNSFSMKRETASGMLLEQAKSKALSIANSYWPGTSFLLLTNQNEPSQQQLLTQAQLISQLGAISESPESLPLSKAQKLLINNLDKQKLKAEEVIYLISDFQEYASDLSEMENDTNRSTILIPLPSTTSTNNLLIDSCWFETPGRQKNREEALWVRIQNQSGQSYQNLPVRLKINDTIKAISNLSIEPETSQNLELRYKNNRAGTHRGLVELDDYPVVYDNQFFFSYDVRAKNKVLAIYQQEDPAINKLKALFLNDENIDFEQTGSKQIQLSQFPEYQCIFLLNLKEMSSGLINALDQFVKRGGSLSIFPGINANINSYNALYRQLKTDLIEQADSAALRMEALNYNHPLLQQVFLHEESNLDLPKVNYSYRFSRSSQSQQTQVIGFNNKQAALSGFPVGLGSLLNFSFPLDETVTDFAQQALFVPLLYNMALNSFTPQEIQHEISNNMVLTIPQNGSAPIANKIAISPFHEDKPVQLSVLNNYANQVRIDLHNIIRQAGFYQLTLSPENTQTLAFNYNRQESLSPTIPAEELTNKLQTSNLNFMQVIDEKESSFDTAIQETNKGIELWQYFLVLTLLFLAAETLIARLWK